MLRISQPIVLGIPTCHNLNENQLSQWKHQLVENASCVFASTDKPSSEVSEKRIAHLEHLVGRMIRAWKPISQHLNHSLTLKPLKDALRHNAPESHHSDQGGQYLSKAYVSTLQENGVEISVGHRGRSWENGYAERLIRTLKEEEVDINEYESIAEARDRIGHFLTHDCNFKRPHSALGYLTPMEFAQQNLS